MGALSRPFTILGMVGSVVEARDRWLAATPAERAETGPDAIATCADALGTLTGRLQEVGYPVSEPIEPCPDLDTALGQFDDVSIVVPPALVAVWREIGTVCCRVRAAHRDVFPN